MFGPMYPPESLDEGYYGFTGCCPECGWTMRYMNSECGCVDWFRQEEQQRIREDILGEDFEWNAGISRNE